MTTEWSSIDTFLRRLGVRIGAPTTGQTTGGIHTAGSQHYSGRARDYGMSGSDVAAITAALLPYAQGAGAPVDELFDSRAGVFYADGVKIAPSAELRQGHYDHVHVGIRPGVDLDAFTLANPKASPGGWRVPGTNFRIQNPVSAAKGAVGDAVGDAVGSVMAGVGRVVMEALFVAAGLALVAMGVARGVSTKEATNGP
ncbi:MAG: hypothetical protein ACR2MO_08605 [Acidimicrobiales bacterium]